MIFYRNSKCDHCDLIFVTNDLLKIHSLIHNQNDDDKSTIVDSNSNCPACQNKFLILHELIQHVTKTHAITISNNVKIKVEESEKRENFKCSVCHKIFAFRERLRVSKS